MVDIELLMWLVLGLTAAFTCFCIAMVHMHKVSMEFIRDLKMSQMVYDKADNAEQAVWADTARKYNEEHAIEPEEPALPNRTDPLTLTTTEGATLQAYEENGQRFLHNPITGERFVV